MCFATRLRSAPLLLAGLLLLAPAAAAQITLSSSLETDRIGRTVTLATRFVQTDVSGLASITGANRTWDLSALPFGPNASMTELDYLIFSDDLPAADLDPIRTSTYAVRSEFRVGDATTTTFTYRVLANDSLSTTGSVSIGDANFDGTADTTVVRNVPPLLALPYPVSFESAWADSTTQFTRIPDVPVESETFVKTEVVVDSWGTLVTPDGSFDCLRQTRTQTIRFFESDFVTETVELVTLDGVSAVLDVANGTASYSVATVSAGGEPGLDRMALRLAAPYPNPFASRTRLTATLPHATDASLAVYDALGRRVATLADGPQPAGPQTFAWTPDAGLAAGLYVAVLRAEGQTVSRRLLLQR